jgi:hypothetical protein
MPPGRFASKAQVWRDHDGAVAAYGYADGPANTMILPNLGAFRFSSERGDRVEADIHPDADQGVVEDVFRRMVVPMVLQVRGLEILHASAVSVEGSVIAFCGTSESGKSTLAYASSGSGNVLWADDSVAFEARDGTIVLTPLPFRLRLRPTSEEYFRASSAQEGLDDAFRVALRNAGPAPLSALFALDRGSAGSELVLERLPPARAFSVVLEHGYCFSLDDPVRKRTMVENYLKLVRWTPVYQVRLPAGLDHIHQTVRTLLRRGRTAAGM